MTPLEDRWWYIERPFPWLLIAVYAAAGVVLAAIGGIAAVMFSDVAAKKLCQ